MKSPRALTPAEFKAILMQLPEPYRIMVLTDACLGLRVSELLGLQWGDIDFPGLTVKIQRSVIEGLVFETKTKHRKACCRWIKGWLRSCGLTRRDPST
jgi:integrase